jgi:hypothetical protein
MEFLRRDLLRPASVLVIIERNLFVSLINTQIGNFLNAESILVSPYPHGEDRDIPCRRPAVNELDRIRFSADINDFLVWFRIDATAGDPRTGTTSSRNPFAIPLAVFRCLACTFMPSMALHVVDFTF